MSLISVVLARQHLRIDVESGDDPESEILPLYIAAAEQAAMEYMNRRVFASAEELAAAVLAGSAGAAPVVVEPAMLAAMLLILGHLYVNREDTVVGISAAELPNGSRFLLNPFRVGMGV